MATDMKRTKHTKVRTGCLTCKIRRKKCDETKPACIRCVSTGRKCDGYITTVTAKVGIVSGDGVRSFLVPLNHVPTADSVHAKWIAPVLSAHDIDNTARDNEEQSRPRNIKLQRTHNSRVLPLNRSPTMLVGIPQISDLESHCISYFQICTLPRLTSYFECSIWRSDLAQHAFATFHPVVFHAVAALGAVHRRFCYGISREAFEYCAHAAKMYDRAAQALEALKISLAERSNCNYSPKSDIAYADRRAVATSEMLLAIFQGFQGEHSASTKHLDNSISSLIRSPVRMFQSRGQYVSELWKPRTFCRMVHLLYCQATQLFDAPIKLIEPRSTDSPLCGSLEIPIMFESLIEARDYLFTVIDNIWGTRPRTGDDLDPRWEAYKVHDTCLRAWTSACARIVSFCETTDEEWPKRAFNLLHITRSIAYLIIKGNLVEPPDHILRSIPPLPTFNVNPSYQDFGDLASSLTSAAEQHRWLNTTPTLLHAKMIAQKILDKYEIFHPHTQPPAEGMWHRLGNEFTSQFSTPETRIGGIDSTSEMLGLYSIAKHISEVEEMAALQAVMNVIPAHAEYPDIKDIMLESRTISIRYHVPHEDGVGFIWREDWWSF